MSALTPRPILKHSNSLQHRSNAVHFPPPPSLTRTFSAHSSATYDRSPIVVSPNSCAIPPRGCPGRTYSVDDPRPNGRVLHPRALEPLPPLILDLSSESSEESDSFLASPIIPPTTCPIYPYSPLAPLDPTALAFLPHPQYLVYESDDPHPKTRKRPQRRCDRSRDRDRIPTIMDGGERDDEAEHHPRNTRHRRVASSGFGVQDADVGCLGGF